MFSQYIFLIVYGHNGQLVPFFCMCNHFITLVSAKYTQRSIKYNSYVYTSLSVKEHANEYLLLLINFHLKGEGGVDRAFLKNCTSSKKISGGATGSMYTYLPEFYCM